MKPYEQNNNVVDANDNESKLEDELVEAAKNANSQWRMPGFQQFLTATFLSDHYSWMWQPASMIFSATAYAIYRYTESVLKEGAVAYAVALWIPGLIWFWILVSAFHVLDVMSNQEGKVFPSRTRVPVMKMVAVTLWNQALSLLICPFSTGIYFNYFGHLRSSKDETFLIFFISYFICGGVYEIAFFTGHFLEHLLPSWYRKYHLLHHTTKADTALSTFYMSFADYCFELLIPMALCIVVCGHFGLSSVAVIATYLLNLTYATAVHSGWHLPGLPDPSYHWLHHSKVAPKGQGINYGTHFFLMDHMFQTAEIYTPKK